MLVSDTMDLTFVLCLHTRTQLHTGGEKAVFHFIRMLTLNVTKGQVRGSDKQKRTNKKEVNNNKKKHG